MADNKKSFVLADESLTDRGFRLLMSGARLERFIANPVMLYMHQRERTYSSKSRVVMPIGKWENIRITGKKLMADPVFDENDPVALSVKRKVENGIINGASPGINIFAWSEDPKQMVQGQTLPTITDWEVMEGSIVDIPANPNAIQMNSEHPDEMEDLASEVLAFADLSFSAGVTPFNLNSETDMFNKNKKDVKKSLKAVIAEHLGKKPEEVTQEEVMEALGAEVSSEETPPGSQNTPDAAQLQADLATANADKDQLTQDLAAKDQEIAELNSQVEALSGAPAKPSKEVHKKTDTPETKPETNNLMSHYSSAQELFAAVSDED